MVRRAILLPIGLAAAPCACDFRQGVLADSPVDSAPDQVVMLPASCATMHADDPALPSGPYEIDPDGSGPELSLTVVCDMTTEGGGWTIIYNAPTPNVMSPPTMYTSATSRLLQDSARVLVAYRTAAGEVLGDTASLALPADWKAATPFSYQMGDITTEVSINGTAGISAMVRYGSQGFAATCADPWTQAYGPWGRLCIVGTRAPFYTGYAHPSSDTCPDSMSLWDAVYCANDRRFTLAVR